MTLKIERSVGDRFVCFTLSGRIQLDHVAELHNLIDFAAAKNNVALDLKEVRLVDRDAVRFLAHCEAEGTKLDNCRLISASGLRGSEAEPKRPQRQSTRKEADIQQAIRGSTKTLHLVMRGQLRFATVTATRDIELMGSNSKTKRRRTSWTECW